MAGRRVEVRYFGVSNENFPHSLASRLLVKGSKDSGYESE